MDPSIMKLLEEDEDESMHSGADVDAFQAALNRDIGGDASTSQAPPSDRDLVQLGSHSANQAFPGWQSTINQDEMTNSQLQQEQRHMQHQERMLLEKELKQHGDAKDPSQKDIHQEVKHLRLHQRQSQDDLQSGQDGESQYLKLQKMSNQQAMLPDQNRSNRFKQVPFSLLLPVILPQLDKDRARQLQTLYDRLMKNDIPKEGFVRIMRGIVGDQMLKLAVMKIQQFHMQGEASAPQSHPRMQSLAPAKFNESQSFPQLHQKGNSEASHTVASSGQERDHTSAPVQGLSGGPMQKSRRYWRRRGPITLLPEVLETRRHMQHQERMLSEKELKQHGDAKGPSQKDIHQEVNHLLLHQRQSQDDLQSGQGEHIPHLTPQMIGMQVSEPERPHPADGESQYLKLQKMSNQQARLPDQNRSNRLKQVPFGLLLPVILPQLDKDRAMQLQTLYARFKKNDIPKEGFVRIMRCIAGDQMLKLAAMKIHQSGSYQFYMQGEASAPQSHPRMQSLAPAKFNESQSFPQLQKGNSEASHPVSTSGQERDHTSAPVQGLSGGPMQKSQRYWRRGGPITLPPEVLETRRADAEVTEAEFKEKEVKASQDPGADEGVEAVLAPISGFGVGSSVGAREATENVPELSESAHDEEEMADDSSIPTHPSVFAPFRGLRPMPIGPETSLRNPKVGIPLVKGALLHGDLVALSTNRPSLSQLAHDILANTASNFADKMEMISAAKFFREEARKWKETAAEERILKEKALEKIELLEFDRNSLTTLLSDKEQRIAALESTGQAVQERLNLDAAEIKELQGRLGRASKKAVEAFEKSPTFLGIGPAAVAECKASNAFQAVLEAGVKRFQDTQTQNMDLDKK